MSLVDVGARCEAHTGEVWLPNCGACISLNREYDALGLNRQTGISQDEECRR